MNKALHSIEIVFVVALGQVPAILSSHAVTHFITAHPADAALVPVASGIAAWLYQTLKAKVKTSVVSSANTGKN